MDIRSINPMSSLCELLNNIYKKLMYEAIDKIHL